MKNLEIWLCKVLVHKPTGKPINVAQLNERAHETVMARIIGGELGTLPNGDIIEPVSSHATEALANDARIEAIAREPHEDWRVVAVGSV